MTSPSVHQHGVEIVPSPSQPARCRDSSRVTGALSVNTSSKVDDAYLEQLSGGSSNSPYQMGAFILSSNARQVPVQRPNTASAAISDAIDQALDLVSLDDYDQQLDLQEVKIGPSGDDLEQRRMFRKELLKDDMGLFYRELSRLKTNKASSEQSTSTYCSDAEDETESENEDDMLLLDFDVSSSDLFQAMDRRSNRSKDVE